MAAKLSLSKSCLDVLARSTITDTSVTLPGQLDRKLYTDVDKILRAAGGRWNTKAIAHLFDRDPREALGLAVASGKMVNRQQTLQAFYTPPELAARLAEFADPQPREHVLEPSCGGGALIAAMLQAERSLTVVAYDIDGEAISKIRGDERVSLTVRDFLTIEPDVFADLVVMNPPFTKDQDIDHVLHAWKFVRPGGRLVSIMSSGRTQGERSRLKKRQLFAAFVEALGGDVMELGGNAFESVGASVYTVMIRLRKPA